MITAVTGRTGEGKTCWAVRFLIIEHLCTSLRPLVTNISLDLEELEKEVFSRGAEYDSRQIISLPCAHETETPTFEVDGEDIVFNPKEFWKVCPKDAVIIFDEAGEYLNSFDLSRNEAAKNLASYARMHRHMGHDVYFLLQDFDQMAKPLRVLVHKHVTLYSLYQHPLFGMFKMKCFIVRTYDIGGSASNKAEKMEWRRYSNRVFEIYNSFQHRDYHESLEFEELNKKTIKRSKLSAMIDRFKSNPLNYFWFLAIAIASYSIFTYQSVKQDFFGEKQSETSEKTEEKTQNENENESAKNDNSSSLNPADVLKSVADKNRYRGERESAPRTTATFGKPKVRGYEVRKNKRGKDKKGDRARDNS